MSEFYISDQDQNVVPVGTPVRNRKTVLPPAVSLHETLVAA
jgi:hypothetical protein